MSKFIIKERIEQNVTIWLLGTLLTGFLAGIGVYRAVQDMAGLTIVSAADREDSKRQRAELEQKLAASEKRATAAAAQVKQAYWAVRGTRIDIMYVERDQEVATELKERLATVGALVTLKPTEQKWFSGRVGKLFYEPGSMEAAMQIKALMSDITVATPEENVDFKPGEVAFWLLRK